DVPLRQSHRLARRAGRSEGAGGLRLVRPACRPVARPDRLGARRPSPLGRALAVPTSDRELTDQPAPEGSPPAPPRWGLGDVVLAVVVALFASSLLFGVWDAFNPGDTHSVGYVAFGLVGLWIGFIGVPVHAARRKGSGSVVEDFGLRLVPVDAALGVAGALVATTAEAIVVAIIRTLSGPVKVTQDVGDTIKKAHG